MTNNEMLYYIAGFFDGEGHIGLVKRKAYRAVPQIMIYNTSKPVLKKMEYFLNSIGIFCTVELKRTATENSRDCWQLRLKGQHSMLMFCSVMEPYLVVKQLMCKVVAAYIRLRLSEGKHGKDYINSENIFVETVSLINQGDIKYEDLEIAMLED